MYNFRAMLGHIHRITMIFVVLRYVVGSRLECSGDWQMRRDRHRFHFCRAPGHVNRDRRKYWKPHSTAAMTHQKYHWPSSAHAFYVCHSPIVLRCELMETWTEFRLLCASRSSSSSSLNAFFFQKATDNLYLLCDASKRYVLKVHCRPSTIAL